MIYKKRYWAAYTQFNCRASMRGNDLAELRRELDARMTKPHDHYAIYHEGSGFHSTAQQEFLVEHYNDLFWINQGVASNK